MINDYETYCRAEWAKFQRETERGRAYLAATATIDVKNVLDIGCGAGQELIPFVVNRGARGVGIDLSPVSGQVGRSLFAELGCADRVEFQCAKAESLPFDNESFDIVICRGVLPLTDNKLTLKEIARVLRPGGIGFLKIQAARYYLVRLFNGVVNRNLTAIHAARALVAGTLYHITGKQPHNRITGREVFQTAWMLRRELVPLGLQILKELSDSDSNPASPVFIIAKTGTP